MSKLKQQLERVIVKQVIDDLLAAGRHVGWNHEGYIEDNDSFHATDSSDATLNDAFACDELRLWTYASEDAWKNRSEFGEHLVDRGWVYFVYGNDGYDVISDYTANLEELLKPAFAFCDKYSD